MAHIQHHETQDVDDQAQALDGFRQFYEQLGRGRFHGSVWQLMMSQGSLLRETSNRSLRQHFTPPADHVTLAMPLAVQPGSRFAGQPLARESLMVLRSGDEYEMISAGEIDLVGLSVNGELLDSLAPPKLEWLQRAQARRVLALPPDVATAIRHMLLAVSTEAEGALPSLETQAQEAALLTATLTQTVLLAMTGENCAAAQQVPRRADTRMKVVRRALDYMRAHLNEDIGVAEIASAACASRRSLQYCFEEFMHSTPQACLRALRLNEARRSLKNGGGTSDQPITHLANELGFASHSHFTRHYKLMFDELPSETLKAYGMNSSGHGV
jgi:AraC family transcriptional regulator, ethanolamine operon transcriptional activator